MATLTRYPTSATAGWTNPLNADADEPNVYATAAPGKNGTTSSDYGGFGFNGLIPAGSVINSVTVEVEWKVSTTASVATLGAQAVVGGAAVGSELVNSAEPTVDTLQSFTVPGLTAASFDGSFVVRIRATRGNTNTGFTASLDFVRVTVDYTPPPPLAQVSWVGLEAPIYAPPPEVRVSWAALESPVLATGYLRQSGFRFRNDDGTEVTATWKAALNSNIYAETNTLFRLRFLVAEIEGVQSSTTSPLLVQQSVNGGAWQSIGDSPAAGKPLHYEASPNIANAPTTQQIGSASFAAGRLIEAEGFGIPGATIPAKGETEYEFVLAVAAANATSGDSIRLRIFGLSGYAEMPTVTVGAPPVGSLIKAWDGGAFTAKPLKRWNGSAWVDATLKRWDGAAWVTE